jgi:large subunit ribosomal protein L21
MYAIVETGGKQYRVKPGDTIAVERLSGEPGEVLDLGRVLLVAGNGDSSTRVGSPGVDGAVVRAEVVEHARGEKIIVFRYKSKVRYRRKTGHRQSLTRVRITDILLDGASTSTRAATQQRAEAEPSRAVEAESAPVVATEATSVVAAEATPVVEAEAKPVVAAETTPAMQPEPATTESAATESLTPTAEDAPAPEKSVQDEA